MAQNQLIQSFYDSINSRDFEKFLSSFSDDGQFRDISTDRVYRGRNEMRQMAENWLKTFPDMKLQVSNVIGSGDDYCVELTMVGTHQGPLETPQGSIAPTGKRINVPSCDVIRIRNGKIHTLSCYFAATVLLSQIGAAPAVVQRAA